MKKIVVGADPFPPYQYVDKKGKIKGLDYETVIKQFRMAGYDPEVYIEPWNIIYKKFEEGKVDALFQVQDSPERLKKYFFSKILRYAVTEVVTTDEKLTEIDTYDQLRKYKIGVIDGFVNGTEIDEMPDECKIIFADTKSLLEGIEHEKVKCGICDKGVKEFLNEDTSKILSITKLTFKRPLYVMFQNEKDRDAFDEAKNLKIVG